MLQGVAVRVGVSRSVCCREWQGMLQGVAVCVAGSGSACWSESQCVLQGVAGHVVGSIAVAISCTWSGRMYCKKWHAVLQE